MGLGLERFSQMAEYQLFAKRVFLVQISWHNYGRRHDLYTEADYFGDCIDFGSTYGQYVRIIIGFKQLPSSDRICFVFYHPIHIPLRSVAELKYMDIHL